ncbi:2-nitropropane dioxygenase [Bacillus sp. FJAT-42376]|uniref:NAD(P)H-dependent flavin oxidoreductase n=1 Tax=Bacillus sp. FJAT-42376 TaxID=2014076 RepID=UPI000F4E2B29|nr:nitronate monooxygenase [Bacillus sp. FJAT-42376]AZB41439.1 2-nitropropane dioxygenase [Bacillus sp. FJAT-42376]
MNRLCEILDIDVPIIQGGMGNISNAQLTAAISEAGALGTIGAGTRTPEEVERIILETKERTNRPFAVNIALSVSAHAKGIAELIVKHDVHAVSLSAGNPAPYIPFFKERGIKILAVTASVKQALKAEAGGADAVVGEGYEAAGLNSPLETTTLTLIPQLADAVSIPIAAAGGIADGRGLAAMLALGAEGVQMGTRFIATKEAPFSSLYKQRLLESDDAGTMIIGRSVGRVRRVLRNPYSGFIADLEREGMTLEEYNERTNEDFHISGAVHGNEETGFWNSGQIAGLIREIPSVKDLIGEMKADMEKTIAGMARYSRSGQSLD